MRQTRVLDRPCIARPLQRKQGSRRQQAEAAAVYLLPALCADAAGGVQHLRGCARLSISVVKTVSTIYLKGLKPAFDKDGSTGTSTWSASPVLEDGEGKHAKRRDLHAPGCGCEGPHIVKLLKHCAGRRLGTELRAHGS